MVDRSSTMNSYILEPEYFEFECAAIPNSEVCETVQPATTVGILQRHSRVALQFRA
jgi:hypothetical protein